MDNWKVIVSIISFIIYYPVIINNILLSKMLSTLINDFSLLPASAKQCVMFLINRQLFRQKHARADTCVWESARVGAYASMSGFLCVCACVVIIRLSWVHKGVSTQCSFNYNTELRLKSKDDVFYLRIWERLVLCWQAELNKWRNWHCSTKGLLWYNNNSEYCIQLVKYNTRNCRESCFSFEKIKYLY